MPTTSFVTIPSNNAPPISGQTGITNLLKRKHEGDDDYDTWVVILRTDVRKRDLVIISIMTQQHFRWQHDWCRYMHVCETGVTLRCWRRFSCNEPDKLSNLRTPVLRVLRPVFLRIDTAIMKNGLRKNCYNFIKDFIIQKRSIVLVNFSDAKVERKRKHFVSPYSLLLKILSVAHLTNFRHLF